jgi:hypothetical protein
LILLFENAKWWCSLVSLLCFWKAEICNWGKSLFLS